MTEIVLVDEHDAEVGVAEKLDAHRRGALHRAFSVFAFNRYGELLLQRRAVTKYHSGGLWTHTCCSHPRPGEELGVAARRRVREELGIVFGDPRPAGTLRYRAALGELIEDELDHLILGRVDGRPAPDVREVTDWRYMAPDDVTDWMNGRPEDFTVWFAPAWRIVSAVCP
jgi:isopentenyl-diphosphate delta-isomerase